MDGDSLDNQQEAQEAIFSKVRNRSPLLSPPACGRGIDLRKPELLRNCLEDHPRLRRLQLRGWELFVERQARTCAPVGLG